MSSSRGSDEQSARRRSHTSAPPLSELVEAALASGSLKALLSLLKISSSYHSHLVLRAEDGQLHKASERTARCLHRYLHRASRCLREADELATDILEGDSHASASTSGRDRSYREDTSLSSHEFDSIRSVVEAAARAVVLAEQYTQQAEEELEHGHDGRAAPSSHSSGSSRGHSREEPSRHSERGSRSSSSMGRHVQEDTGPGSAARGGRKDADDKLDAVDIDEDYEDDDDDDDAPTGAPFTPTTPDERAILLRALGPKPSMLRMQLADVVKNAVVVSRSRSGSVVSAGLQGEEGRLTGRSGLGTPASSAPATQPGSARSTGSGVGSGSHHHKEADGTDQTHTSARIPSAFDMKSSPVPRAPATSTHPGTPTSGQTAAGGREGTGAKRVASLKEMVDHSKTNIITPSHHTNQPQTSARSPLPSATVGSGSHSPAAAAAGNAMTVGNVIQTPMGPMVVVQGPHGPMAIPVAGSMGVGPASIHSLVGHASQVVPGQRPSSGIRASPDGKPLPRVPSMLSRTGQPSTPEALFSARARARSRSHTRADSEATKTPGHTTTEMVYDPKQGPPRGRSPARGAGDSEEARSASRTRVATSRSISRASRASAKTPPTRYKPPQYEDGPQDDMGMDSSAEAILTTLARKHSGIPKTSAR